jgi:hypothetical protein
MLIMLGGFELVLAITEFFRFAFGALPNIADVLNYSILWGILDVLYGLVLLYAGYAVLERQAVGRRSAGSSTSGMCPGPRWSSSASVCSSSTGW